MSEFPTPAIIMNLQGYKTPRRFDFDACFDSYDDVLKAFMTKSGYYKYRQRREEERMSRAERFWRSAIFKDGKWRDGSNIRPGMTGEEYLAQIGAKHGAEGERVREEDGRSLRDARVGGRGARAASAVETKDRPRGGARKRKNGAGARRRVRGKS